MTEEGQVWLGAVGLCLHVRTTHVSFKAQHPIFMYYSEADYSGASSWNQASVCIKIRHQIKLFG